MKLFRLDKEVTYYMEVELENGEHRTYVRTAFSEWCIEVYYNSASSLERLPGGLAEELERIFQAHPY